VSQMLTLYTTPVVYIYMDRFRAWISGGKALCRLERTVSEKDAKVGVEGGAVSPNVSVG